MATRKMSAICCLPSCGWACYNVCADGLFTFGTFKLQAEANWSVLTMILVPFRSPR